MTTPTAWHEAAARALERERWRPTPEPYESPIELAVMPTYHYEERRLPDGTTVRWPVLDGPLPPPVIGNWDEDYDRDR